MYNFKHTQLDNGLDVITAQKDSSVVVSQLWLQCGSRYEKDEERGVSHMLEHLLLDGTKNRPGPVELQSEIEDLGGDLNATTRKEETFFYTKVPKNKKEEGLEIIADIIQNPLFKQEHFRKEKEVVLKEKQEELDNPEDKLSLKSLEKFFGSHPLAKNVLGSKDEIREIELEDIKRFYEKFYRPSRAVLVISGGVSHKESIELTQNHLSSWQNRSNFKETDSQKELPNLNGERLFLEEDSIENTILHINYRGFSISERKKDAALDLVSIFLTGGMSSFLYDKLRNEKGLVYGVGSYNASYSDVGRFNINTSSSEPEKVLKIINECMDGLKDKLTSQKINKLKEKNENRLWVKMDNPYKIAHFLGFYFTFHEKPYYPQDYIEDIESVDEKLIGNLDNFLKPSKRLVSMIGPKDSKLTKS
ncbi:MAG: M16 family metallopeptidase [Candidatus Magasanikbacteria bacterium]